MKGYNHSQMERKLQVRFGLAYILTSVDRTCKAMIGKLRCPRDAWEVLKQMFQSVAEAAIYAKLSQLWAIFRYKVKNIVEYSSRIVGLVGELKSVGYDESNIEQKHGLLRGLREDYDVTAETIVSPEHDCSGSVQADSRTNSYK